MGVHVEWATTAWMDITVAGPGEEMPDGQKIDADKMGLCLGGDDLVVIEGTREGLLAKLESMIVQVTDWEPDSDERECANCGDAVQTLSSRDWCDGCEAEAASPAEGA